MSSIVEGYEYDIFISYRQNDNHSDKWVTNFVNALKEELEATLKNPVSIYFDENPHDGLLETHQVDASLAKKLKCLVFIPIVSQTYCDPYCFAWEQEFIPFIEMVKEDELGMNITVSNGNVTSRVLPIKIHELDTEDQYTLEAVLDGPLRSIDFIYQEPGVNRPLRPNDSEEKNLNKTRYRNQINKVANALKDIGLGILKQSDQKLKLPTTTPLSFKESKNKTKAIITSISVMVILAIAYFIYDSKITGESTTNKTDKSIAVLAFENMSNDPEQEYFADGLSEELINLLTQVPELTVIGRSSSFAFKGKKEDLRTIANKLGVTHILEGSVRKSGENLRITAQLINGDDGSHLWSQSYDRTLDDIFNVQDEIAGIVTKTLKVTLLEKSNTKNTTNADAYNLFLRGKFFYENTGNIDDTHEAMHWFKESIKLDSTFSLPWTYLSMCYWRKSSTTDQPEFREAKIAAEKALDLDPNSSIAATNLAEILDNEYNMEAAEDKIVLALKLGPNDPYVLRNACRFYTMRGMFEQSIEYGKQALKNDPIQRTALLYLFSSYFYSGQFNEAKILLQEYKKFNNGRHHSVYYNTLLEEGNASQVIEDSRMGYQNNDSSLVRPSIIAAANFILGNNEEAERILVFLANTCADDCAYYIARAYAYGENPEKAIGWLERSYTNKEKTLPYLGVDPAFKKYLNEQEVREILKKIQYPM
ncbi:MAG: hypothetical protein ABFS32_13795 [Bacteroidota bacterium]